MEGRYIPFQWPSDNVSDDGDVGHPSFNYSGYGIDNSRASASYRDDPTVAFLRMLSELWLSMPVALLGIVGNLISLVVLCYHRRLKKLKTIVIQLQALAVVDTLILLTIPPLRLSLVVILVFVTRSCQKAALRRRKLRRSRLRICTMSNSWFTSRPRSDRLKSPTVLPRWSTNGRNLKLAARDAYRVSHHSCTLLCFILPLNCSMRHLW